MMSAVQKRILQAWFVICLLVLCTCVPLPSHAEQKVYEGSGSDTPEDAVLIYLEGLKEQDIEKMISAYAVETYIDHFDLKAQITRLGAYASAMIPRVPNSGDLLRAVNVESRKNEIVQSVLWQMTSICLPGRDFTQVTAFERNNIDAETEAFVKELENAFSAVDFSTLKILGFMNPEQISELYASERNQENLKKQAAPFGPEEARSVVALFALDEKLCALCCDVMRYEDRWYMYKPLGNIGALIGLSPMTGGMVAVPQDELATMREGLDAAAQEMLDAILGDYIQSQ